MIPGPKVAVVYICPVERFGLQHTALAGKFKGSLDANPPGYPHDLVIVSNGGEPSQEVSRIFSTVNAKFITHDDSGKDIGAYQFAASHWPCDLMVFLGGSTYLKGKGWLARIVASFEKHGPALYGVMGHTGDQRFNVWPHIRTTGFWMPPELMNQYPEIVSTDDRRYPFEHGSNCLTQWVRRQGLKALVVTWTNEYEQQQWGAIPNGYHNGDQSAMLLGDRLCEPPYHPIA